MLLRNASSICENIKLTHGGQSTAVPTPFRLELTPGQRGFELCRSTGTQMFSGSKSYRAARSAASYTRSHGTADAEGREMTSGVQSFSCT